MSQGDNIEKKISSGLVWTYMERLLAQGVTTIVTIVLARKIVPENYGIVSIVTIFITICDALVVGGFSDTLIQKMDADDIDFSTLYWFVLFLGMAAYGVMFFLAPVVEKFFHTDLITVVLRVMAIRIPINAIRSIQSAYISKHMKYKFFFFATLGGTLVSAIAGIAMAYMGCGVWALVVQYLTNSFMDTVIIWFTCGWRPKFIFSFERLKILYSFGWKMQMSSLLSTLYNELETFCIGLKYTSADLAYYDKGRQFPKLILRNIQTSVSKVMLPTFSILQKEPDEMKKMAKKSLRVCVYCTMPLIIGLMLCAEEFTIAVLTEKWMPSIPFLRLLAIYYLCEPIMSINKQIVIASGDSKKYLIMEIQKKVIGSILIFCALVFTKSVLAIAIAVVVTQVIGLLIQSMPLKKIIGYPLYEQLHDVFPPLIMSGFMIFPIALIKKFKMGVILKLIFEVFCGATIYILASVLTRNSEMKTLIKLIKKIVKKGD